jgi:hypothetical protein
VVTIPLAPRTARAIDLAVGERLDGPIFTGPDGGRLDRHAAGRIVRRVARHAGITKPVGPHALRHAFITAALDAGVPLRDVQEAASHADPRTPMRYDRARASLDHHATYIVAALSPGLPAEPQCPFGRPRARALVLRSLVAEVRPQRPYRIWIDLIARESEDWRWQPSRRTTSIWRSGLLGFRE